MLTIDGEAFDGYLGELAKGLGQETAHLDDAGRKMAVVMPDGMLREAAVGGLTADGAVLRAFGAGQLSEARAWVAAMG